MPFDRSVLKPPAPGELIRKLILEKSLQHASEGQQLKVHYHRTYESLRPVNIIRDTIKNVFVSPELKTGIVNYLMGIASGFIVKKVITGRSSSTLASLAGMVMELVVSRKVSSNGAEIRVLAALILRKIMDRTASGKEPA